MADELDKRAELLHEIVAATSDDGAQRGIIIVGGYVSEFVDEFCGDGFRLVWPYPGPPPQWFASELEGADLLVLASQFAAQAAQAFGEGLQDQLAAGSAEFAAVAVTRMQAPLDQRNCEQMNFWAGPHGAHPRMLLAGEIMIAAGIIFVSR
jgi:hypothetical protein